MSRPRLALTDDERVERRRRQYRNAKARARGLPEEPTPLPRAPSGSRPVSVLLGSRWVPALIDPEGRRVFLT